MAKTNLSLGNLYRAVSGSARVAQVVSLGGLAGSAANSSFGSFAIDSVTVNLPTYTYIVESTTETATFSFGSAGSLHGSKVGSVAANYSVTFDNANFSVGSPTLGASPSFPITPASIASSNYSEASSVLSMKYADGYNLAATNYNTTSTKTLYAVDVYNTINQPDFCLVFGTMIEKADGTSVAVEDLNVGDEIKAWVPNGLPDENQDPESKEIDWRFFQLEAQSGSAQTVVVADIVYNFASGYFSLNDGEIKATGTHPLWVFDSEIEKYHFKNVEDILIGDMIVKWDDFLGETVEVEVTNIEIVTEDVEIATINVEQADVYMANGFISHNKGTTTQPHIPSSGLRLYVDQYKTVSYNSGSAGADWMDLSGYNTGVRPAGAPNAAGITGGNPTSTNGATKKASYVTFNGSDQFFYKDTTTNINGGYSQFNTNTGTIHVWVRPTTTLGTTSRFIFDYAGFYGLAIESTDSSTLNRIKFYGSSLGNSAQLTTSLSSGTNYLISATFQSSGTCTIYVDGSSIGTFTSSAFTAPSSTNYLTIGCNSARTSFWNGGIQAVLFYNVLQSAATVQQVYNHFSTTLK